MIFVFRVGFQVYGHMGEWREVFIWQFLRALDDQCDTIRVQMLCKYNMSTDALYVQYKYICFVCTIQVHMLCMYNTSTDALYVQYKYLCLCMYNTSTYAYVCTIQVHMLCMYTTSTDPLYVQYKYRCFIRTIRVQILCMTILYNTSTDVL